MSKSRLEKFLYALYSLDSSDLPTPLSRIEELYNCLVTGEEAPAFEPLSRVEKYLMAILGAYDVDSLPNPLSRVEVLLYKLATGDDNLDDVESFLSEHEELLAEIIRNGGVGGNIDIEYVLYTLSTEFNTLYNTEEKPVKSAILKGNTKYRDIDTGDILDTFDETKNLELVSVQMPVLTTSNEDGTKTNILTTSEEAELRGIGDVKDELNLLTCEFTQRIGEIVLDGNTISGLYTSVQDGFISAFFEIPNIKNQPQYEEIGQTYIITNKFISTIFGWDMGFENISIHPTITDRIYLTLKLDTIGITTDMDYEEKLRLFIKYLSENTLTAQYQLKTESVKTVDLSVVNQDGNNTKLSTFNDITHVTLSSEGLIPAAELEVATKNEEDLEDSIVYTTHILSEEFNTLYNTAEKPIKSAILKGQTLVNLVGEDKKRNILADKMPVLTTTGKNLWCGDKDVFIANGIEHFNMSFKKGTYYFTGDVDTVYPNGSTTIVFSNTFTGYEVGVYINNSNSSATLKEDCNQVKIYTNGWSFANSTNKPQTIKNLMLSNTYPISYEPYKSNILTVNEEVTLRSNGDVYDELNLLTGRLAQRIDENNEVLSQEVVKTVDLSVVDQDGNNTKLSTFNDITHVTLSSEGLIPEAELKVAEKVTEVAASMFAISHEQEVIDTATNEQSENVDATMIATTEIYEELL